MNKLQSAPAPLRAATSLTLVDPVADSAVESDPTPVSFPWIEIVARVVDAFPDRESPGMRYALNEWRKHSERVRQAGIVGDAVHHCTAPEVIDALVEFFRADVAENLAIYQVKLANKRRDAALARLPEVIGEFGGYLFEADEGDRIIAELGVVERRDAAAKIREVRGLVDAARAAADGSETPFPGQVGEFEKDLRSFLAEHADEGRDLVLRICGDREFAKDVSGDKDMPRPIRFLGDLVVQATPAPLTKSKSALGFQRS